MRVFVAGMDIRAVMVDGWMDGWQMLVGVSDGGDKKNRPKKICIGIFAQLPPL